jgi:hypothetical protein
LETKSNPNKNPRKLTVWPNNFRENVPQKIVTRKLFLYEAKGEWAKPLFYSNRQNLELKILLTELKFWKPLVSSVVCLRTTESDFRIETWNLIQIFFLDTKRLHVKLLGRTVSLLG